MKLEFELTFFVAWFINELRLLQRQGSGSRSCSELPRVSYNEGFIVRSARE
jgi:hypothetical protein